MRSALGTSSWRFLKTQNITRKKSLHAAEQDRPDLAAKRRAFIRRQPSLDPTHLVFIDETWATTNMARRQGARGSPLAAVGPGAARALESDHPRGRPAQHRDHRAMRL
jgi:hypothetical protein